MVSRRIASRNRGDSHSGRTLERQWAFGSSFNFSPSRADHVIMPGYRRIEIRPQIEYLNLAPAKRGS
jgi:hypothetical protein